MRVRKLKEILSGIPDDFEVCATRMIGLEKRPNDPQYFTVVLDYPIRGIVENKDDNKVRFVVEGNRSQLKNLGKVWAMVDKPKTKVKRRKNETRNKNVL